MIYGKATGATDGRSIEAEIPPLYHPPGFGYLPDRQLHGREPTMDKTTKGAWLLAQSKSLDAVTGAGAARLENISYAGHIGRLYNLLRRNVANDLTPTIDAATVTRICQLNNIDRPSREMGLKVLAEAEPDRCRRQWGGKRARRDQQSCA